MAIPPVSREGGRTGLPKKGKWSPRGTGNREAPLIPAQASRVSVALRERAKVTGKAGENGQHSGEVGGSSAWTRPSAPECGDTLKALAGDQRPILGGDRLQNEDGSRVAVDWVTGWSYSSARRQLSMYSQANVREESVLRHPTRALPSVIVDTEKVLREVDGSVELVVVRPHADGKVFAPGCASKAGLVSW